jgi:uncharacterized membrane protein
MKTPVLRVSLSFKELLKKHNRRKMQKVIIYLLPLRIAILTTKRKRKRK